MGAKESLRGSARPRIEPATSWSQVRRPTVTPRRLCCCAGGLCWCSVVGGRSRLHLLDLGSCGRAAARDSNSSQSLSLSSLGAVLLALLSGQRHIPHRWVSAWATRFRYRIIGKSGLCVLVYLATYLATRRCNLLGMCSVALPVHCKV